MYDHPFPPEELDARITAVRSRLAADDLDGIVISVPENIYYLTGLDHWGFFACHLLVVPRDGELVLTCRAMEGITVGNQVRNAAFLGHSDTEDIADYAVRSMARAGLRGGRIGMEMQSLFLTPRNADAIREKAPGVAWRDASGLVDELRLVKSPLEMGYTRRAARAADAGTLAAIEATRDGASDYEIAAECQRAMTLAGSEYPGFGPFIRPTSRLGEEHTTWRGDSVHDGDAVFLELAAAFRKYQAPMGRLVYVGHAPAGAEASARLAIDGMEAICAAITAGRAGRRRLPRMARGRGGGRACRLSPPPLRLSRLHWLSAELDRRVEGDRAGARLRLGAEGRHDLPRPLLVHEHGRGGLLHLQYRAPG